MKIEQLLTTLSGRGVTQAALRAGNQMQLQVNGQWQAQNATLTDEALAAMIDEALDPSARVAWTAPDGRASFDRQGFSVAARKTGGAVQILIKHKDQGIAAAPIAASPLQTTAQSTTQTVVPVRTQTPAPSNNWFTAESEGEKGPFAPQKMQMMVSMGTVPAHTLVWREGMENWTALQNTELAAHLPPVETMPPIAAPTGAVYQPRGRVGTLGNDSGTGEGAQLPPGIGKWNWGAFFFPVFWGWSHNQSGRAWAIFGTNFIPFVGGIISFVLTIMMASQGNSLAWKHRRWDSVEHLKKTEQVWSYWAIGFIVLSLLVLLIAVLGSN